MEKKSVVEVSDLFPIETIKIYHAESFLNIPLYEDTALLTKGQQHDFMLPKDIKDVYVKDHAYKRWNTRVGPYTTDRTIRNIFKVAILAQPHRIYLLEKNLAILDEEFVFAFEISDDILTIKTFYGRISIVPSLANVEVLRRYNLHNNEQINLEIPEAILSQQLLPMAPASSIEFEDECKKYQLFHFKCEAKKNYYLYLEADKENISWHVSIIDMQHANRSTIPHTILHILGLLGYNEFLIRYIKLFEPKRFEQLHESHSNRAINRFMGISGWKSPRKEKSRNNRRFNLK